MSLCAQVRSRPSPPIGVSFCMRASQRHNQDLAYNTHAHLVHWTAAPHSCSIQLRNWQPGNKIAQHPRFGGKRQELRNLAYRISPCCSIELVQQHKHRPWGVWRLVCHEVQERKCIFWPQRSSNSPVQAQKELAIGSRRAWRAAQAVKVCEEAI